MEQWIHTIITALAAFAAACVPILLTGIKLHEKVSRVDARVDALEKQHVEHKSEISGLDGKIDKIGNDIVRMETEIEHISEKIDDLKALCVAK